ncbi:indolepyruvate ferredoxin oxidoreductase subunit alpha [Methanolobus mangrovi]|uniref:Indolepyruvate oxidoreductase subunit IorA n=1 Tax=Methanolobus mangrovi TaxID=3072977 RepID=A0AA51YJZ8_9EURY|nr:indolepyruvate ferredoxin oxidoreductase subunit alpha [Methanolobus mangrovi]WMW23118.1 indolepyruvate ferredoxin oxidoreductase subunit alpha [Methanolobus mangrovi]
MTLTGKRILMGNEAIAFGAMKAGLQIASGYPGTPSSEVMETIISHAKEYGIYAEWATNEKVALETAVGAAYSGANAIVTMKQVGLNVASDPLMSLSYIGVKGSLVILVSDDPGPHSSQTEQDTRAFGHFSNIPVLDPSTPQEAYDMAKLAFKLSHELETPVILRTTTRVSHGCADVIIEDIDPVPRDIEGFVKDTRWTIFPKLTAQRHPLLEELQVKMSDRFSEYFTDNSFNSITKGSSNIGIAASGVSSLYVQEAIKDHPGTFSFFKTATAYPFPEKAALDFMKGISDLIVVEELDPYMEEQFLQIAGRHHLTINIHGKKDGSFSFSGEYDVDVVIDGINRALDKTGSKTCRFSHSIAAIKAEDIPSLPIRAPTLCAGCMHRTVFYGFKKAAAKMRSKTGVDSVFSGDIGCYTLGNARPLNMVNTCLCMGAGISIAAGLSHTQEFGNGLNAKQVAFIGDSTFFHSGIAAVVSAVYNNANITIAVLDNRTTAMTGHQPHPGIGITAMGSPAKMIDIAEVLKSCGVGMVKTIEADDLDKCMDIATEAMKFEGPSAVVFKGKCVAICKGTGQYIVDEDKCTGCKLCISQLGCPAIFSIPSGLPVIQDTCSGCGLCAQICPSDAIVLKEVSQ